MTQAVQGVDGYSKTPRGSQYEYRGEKTPGGARPPQFNSPQYTSPLNSGGGGSSASFRERSGRTVYYTGRPYPNNNNNRAPLQEIGLHEEENKAKHSSGSAQGAINAPSPPRRRTGPENNSYYESLQPAGKLHSEREVGYRSSYS